MLDMCRRVTNAKQTNYPPHDASPQNDEVPPIALRINNNFEIQGGIKNNSKKELQMQRSVLTFIEAMF